MIRALLFKVQDQVHYLISEAFNRSDLGDLADRLALPFTRDMVTYPHAPIAVGTPTSEPPTS